MPVVYLLVLIGFPIVYNLVMSVQEVTLGNIADFWRPVRRARQLSAGARRPGRSARCFVNSLVFVVGQRGRRRSASACCVALFFSQQFPGAHFLRGLLLAAWMLPALVVGALWKWMFATEYGVVNFVARRRCG